ncbi:hypothetical protein AMAG_20012 [Allomyces macrogynus ATCC 38327]|uniref:SH3 domain-containing protein n=1 Tax=Allomyces macrogynus (strain ATCC 38327) TaxID=578462 RepID=A0A0L0T4K7_ALLM3|nr:hypothetical protein AMAG_20012 [Allomyces macrogynus ATCC 38327]|eukprot:KNE69646.1 hypothetical protein AMAG_20012 [Allomyces macrogynus ATCC 38327]
MPPGSPGEFGSGKHAEALDHGQYFDDRYGAPPPPPPQGNGYPPSPAGGPGGYGNDYYGQGNSPAGPMPAPLPPNSPMNNNANASRSRETWAAVAPRQSVRPRSMMPHSVPRARPVVLSYAPRLEDELDLHRGDMVTLWEDNGDGYGYGQVADGREGMQQPQPSYGGGGGYGGGNAGYGNGNAGNGRW